MINISWFKGFVHVALCCCMFYTSVKAQDCMACDEKLKSFLFTTVVLDGSQAYFPSDWSKWHKWMQENFNYFEVVCTDSFSLKKPCRSCSSSNDKYSIRLFRLTLFYGERYLLFYKDFCNEEWFRLRGYAENDIKLLFDHLREEGCLKKDLKTLVDEWSALDDMFAEVDMHCLLRGYLRERTSYNCFESELYKLVRASCVDCDVLEEDEIYATFSRFPFSGGGLLDCTSLFESTPCTIRDWLWIHGLLPY